MTSGSQKLHHLVCQYCPPGLHFFQPNTFNFIIVSTAYVLHLTVASCSHLIVQVFTGYFVTGLDCCKLQICLTTRVNAFIATTVGYHVVPSRCPNAKAHDV